MEFPEKNGLIISAAFTATKILTLSLTGPDWFGLIPTKLGTTISRKP